MPSKTGLLLGRICVYIQLALVARLVSLAILSAVADWPGLLLSFVPYLVLIERFRNIRIRAQDSDRERLRPKNSFKPDYWQLEWQRKAQTDTRTPKDAWRTVLATVIIAAGAGFLLACTYRMDPNQGRTILGDVVVWFYVTFLFGPFLGNFMPFQPRRVDQNISCYRDNPGDDDDGLAGVGARVRPPTPVLSAGNHFPEW